MRAVFPTGPVRDIYNAASLGGKKIMIIKRENAVKGFFYFFFFQRSQVFPTAAFGSWLRVWATVCAGASVHGGGGGGGSGRISGRGKEIKMNQGKRRREQEYSWESPSKGWPGLKRHVIYFRDLCGELVTQLLVTERRKKKKKGLSESSAGQEEEEEEAEQRHERNGNFNKRRRGERSERSN